ncbi:multiple C2 and transmembrane domain-containing protein-like isoform X2 [Trichoplusia ni]|uniref:Multiple C2 and transmembrane domain-containing protein-like isoform X2 n=1 Tax=Trichoplusia ni TaxID=7111 RepID=A0A7E5VVI7_TRINI|nr:multiple C2 and transmembrane domain-containing protein-like isoform X2 [Trichoplusia ni]
MEQAPKTDSLTRRHFARLHERIQSKYDEMQRKLEKSKSVDSLSSLKEDYVYKDNRYATSNNDISKMEEMTNDTSHKKSHVKHSIIIEEIREYDNDSDANKFFGDDFSKLSLESLNEVARESDECQTPTPEPPTTSIRRKFGSRITAVKERRREAEKEKNAIRGKNEKKTAREKVEKFIFSNTPNQDVLKTYKRTKIATVTIALIEATGLENDISDDKTRLLNCRFRLGSEKHKSRVIKTNATEVKWQELFNFNLYEDTCLEITLCDKNFAIGKSQIELSELDKERTHKMKINLDCEVGRIQIFMLLTISGFSFMSLEDYQETERQIEAITQKSSSNSKVKPVDVGLLTVIVYGAKGLSGHECYCVLELDNERLQTYTESKTNDPNWTKIFNFQVTDIASTLEISIHDEKKSESIGSCLLPLLSIENGKKKWYALKDNDLRERAKGNNPRILLEMRLTWNLVKASVRAINPKQVKYLEPEEKLDRHTFSRNLARAKVVLAWILDSFQVTKTCFEWESRKMNAIALSIWLPFCWFFKIWMVPLLLLIPFVWYRPPKYFLLSWKDYLLRRSGSQDDGKKEKVEEKKETLRQKINSLQEMVQSVQNFLGKFANLGESIKNLFNFTVPFLSLLAIFLILVVGLVMFLIPTKYIFMIWGIHKFTRKILRPNRIANNEILDLLSRVPNDEVLLNWEQLPLEELPEEDEIN